MRNLSHFRITAKFSHLTLLQQQRHDHHQPPYVVAKLGIKKTALNLYSPTKNKLILMQRKLSFFFALIDSRNCIAAEREERREQKETHFAKKINVVIKQEGDEFNFHHPPPTLVLYSSMNTALDIKSSLSRPRSFGVLLRQHTN
jgi:hypothetical protein